MTTIVTGDDIDLSVTLQTSGGSAVDVSAATSIKVALANPTRTASVAGPYTASSGTSGASWGSGVVVVRVPAADSAAITNASVLVEVQVVLGGATTTYLGTARVAVIPGVIP